MREPHAIILEHASNFLVAVIRNGAFDFIHDDHDLALDEAINLARDLLKKVIVNNPDDRKTYIIGKRSSAEFYHPFTCVMGKTKAIQAFENLRFKMIEEMEKKNQEAEESHDSCDDHNTRMALHFLHDISFEGNLEFDTGLKTMPMAYEVKIE